MKKNDIFRQAAQHEMPDIEQVRKECIEELHTSGCDCSCLVYVYHAGEVICSRYD